MNEVPKISHVEWLIKIYGSPQEALRVLEKKPSKLIGNWLDTTMETFKDKAHKKRAIERRTKVLDGLRHEVLMERFVNG
jgi:hypothetical protein